MQVQAKITSKNQITIPQAVREALKLNKNDKTIVFNIKDNESVILEKPKNNLWDIVDTQEKVYGNIDTPEIVWGEDVGEERID